MYSNCSGSVGASVLDGEHKPTLNAVLSREWQHIDILEAYAAAL